MSLLEYKRIFARRHRNEIVGRNSEMEELLQHARNARGGLLLLSAPRIGVSELMQQVCDELFATETATVPVYFQFDNRFAEPRETGRRFAHSFLTQLSAFRRRDPLPIFTSPGIPELRRLAHPRDDGFVEETIGILSDINSDEPLSFVRSCFSLPLRAMASGIKVALFLDDVHNAPQLISTAAIAELLSRGDAPFVMSARRRSAAVSGLRRVDVDSLSLEDLGGVAQNFGQKAGIEIPDTVRDLAALRCDGDLVVLHALIDEASQTSNDLSSFRAFEATYTSSVFGGAINTLYTRVLATILPSSGERRRFTGLLADLYAATDEGIATESWRKRTGLSDAEFDHCIRSLNIEEVIRLSSNRIGPMNENRILSDFLQIERRLETASETRASIFADVLSGFIKSAPSEMAAHYRRSSSVGLRELMMEFEGKSVAGALLDYGIFNRDLKGLPADQIVSRISESPADFPLPQIVFSAPTESFYRAIGLTTERERSAVAIGFEQGDLGGENRTAWIAAEIPSKLEATAKLAESWCDRLETAAAVSGFLQYKLWLIAPEGFSSDALDLIARRNGIGSSRRQVDLLSELLKKGSIGKPAPVTNEYEIVIPMTEDAEMVAVHTLEDIARRHNFPPQDINRIKTALIEACINATEHSNSPDRRIHHKFTVGKDRITITISNRGVRLADRAVAAEPNEGRRGWGLKLIRQLMDDVRFEVVDDGTRISMTKYFLPA